MIPVTSTGACTRASPSTAVQPSGRRSRLPVSRRLAQLLGGDLVVESTRDQGTLFTCWLPLRAGAEQHPEHRATMDTAGVTRE